MLQNISFVFFVVKMISYYIDNCILPLKLPFTIVNYSIQLVLVCATFKNVKVTSCKLKVPGPKVSFVCWDPLLHQSIFKFHLNQSKNFEVYLLLILYCVSLRVMRKMWDIFFIAKISKKSGTKLHK